MNDSNSILKRYKASDVTFEEVWKSCESVLSDAVVIAYGPKCTVTTLKEAPDDAFECRAFNDSCELRWLKAGRATGNAVLLSTGELELSEKGWDVCDFQYPIISALDNEYLLWGKRKGTTATLFDHRVGTITVPALPSGGDAQRAVLKAVEYIAVDDKYGNCAVVAERLTGFAWHAGGSGGGSQGDATSGVESLGG